MPEPGATDPNYRLPADVESIFDDSQHGELDHLYPGRQELERELADPAFATDAAIREGMADALGPTGDGAAQLAPAPTDAFATDAAIAAEMAALDADLAAADVAITEGEAVADLLGFDRSLAAVDQLDAAEGRPAAADLKAIREYLCCFTIGPPTGAELSQVALRVDDERVFAAWAQVLLEVADRVEGAHFERRLGAYPGRQCSERAVLWLSTASAVFVHGPWRPATPADFERMAAESE